MNFQYLLKKYFSGNLSFDDLPQLAIAALLEGYDTPALIILAGLDKTDEAFEKEKYFNEVLKELNISILSKRDACISYALVITDEIIAGRKEVIKGVDEIYRQAILNYDFYSENKNYVYDSINFERVYGLYNDYDDLQDTWMDDEISKQEMIEEIKGELLEELIVWRRKWN